MKQKIIIIAFFVSILTILYVYYSKNSAIADRQLPIDKTEKEIVQSKTGNLAGMNGKVLIVYFSWADNTVFNQNMDVLSSASSTIPGNTAVMAQLINSQIGGELYPIKVKEAYPYDYDKCLDRAANEKIDRVRPELLNTINNFDDYDIIFLGFPNWCYTAPMAVFSFIEQYDFSNKTVIPFCSHGTGGVAGSVKDIIADLPSTTEVLPAIDINRDDMGNAETVISAWLDSIGFQNKESSSGKNS